MSVTVTLSQIKINGDVQSLNGPPIDQVRSALARATEEWEKSGEDVDLEIYVDKTVKEGLNPEKTYCRSLWIVIDRFMELDEAIDPDLLQDGDWIKDWLIENNIPGERAEEQERPEGMSWVHMSIKNDNHVVGKVTACIVPDRELPSYMRVSFAFCRGGVPFSKRQGRILSQMKIDRGTSLMVLSSSTRYNDVENIIMRTLHGQSLLNCTEDSATQHFPKWVFPNYRGDIPEDVKELLEELYVNMDTRKSVRARISQMIGRDLPKRSNIRITHVRDHEKKNPQIAVTTLDNDEL